MGVRVDSARRSRFKHCQVQGTSVVRYHEACRRWLQTALRRNSELLQVERNINAVHRDHMAAVESALADAREDVADRDAKLAQVRRCFLTSVLHGSG